MLINRFLFSLKMHRAQYTNLFLFHQIYIEESYEKT